MAPILSLPCIAIDGLQSEEANKLAAVSLKCSVCEGVELSPLEADVRVGLEGVVRLFVYHNIKGVGSDKLK